jgi:hypothetical protein
MHVSLLAAVMLVARSLLPVARAVLLLVVTCSCSVLMALALSCLLLLWGPGTRVQSASRLGRLDPILARFRSAAAHRRAVRDTLRWLQAHLPWAVAQASASLLERHLSRDLLAAMCPSLVAMALAVGPLPLLRAALLTSCRVMLWLLKALDRLVLSARVFKLPVKCCP